MRWTLKSYLITLQEINSIYKVFPDWVFLSPQYSPLRISQPFFTLTSLLWRCNSRQRLSNLLLARLALLYSDCRWSLSFTTCLLTIKETKKVNLPLELLLDYKNLQEHHKNCKKQLDYLFSFCQGPLHTMQNFVCFAKNSVNRKPFTVRMIFFLPQFSQLSPHIKDVMENTWRPTKFFVSWQLSFTGSSNFANMTKSLELKLLVIRKISCVSDANKVVKMKHWWLKKFQIFLQKPK